MLDELCTTAGLALTTRCWLLTFESPAPAPALATADRTAAICHENPYEGRHTAPAHGDQHPSVVRPCDDNEEVQKRALGGVWFPIAFFTLLPLLLPVILVVLAVMSWQVIGVVGLGVGGD